MKKDIIIFDLDGTIIDSSEGIIGSFQITLKRLGINEDKENLYRIIGPPLIDSFVNLYDFDREKSREAIRIYRENFQKNGITKHFLYDGIADIIVDLQSAGKTLLLATTKPEKYAVEIMESYDLAKHFTYVGGASFDETRVNKADVITHSLAHAGIDNSENAIMVGDTVFDIQGARQVNIPTVSVLYGFGKKEELLAENPAQIAHTVKDLRSILL